MRRQLSFETSFTMILKSNQYISVMNKVMVTGLTLITYLVSGPRFLKKPEPRRNSSPTFLHDFLQAGEKLLSVHPILLPRILTSGSVHRPYFSYCAQHHHPPLQPCVDAPRGRGGAPALGISEGHDHLYIGWLGSNLGGLSPPAVFSEAPWAKGKSCV